MSRYLETERHGDVTVVRIDRPPANALDIALLSEGSELLGELASDPPAAVVLCGREGFFSAGVDLKLAPTLDGAGQRQMVTGINRLFAGWYSFPRPVVGAITGHAIAGGLILALCTDHRVGVPGARYGLTELRAGIPYPAVAMEVVRAELSPAAARALVLSAELIDADEALARGALDEVVAPDEVLDRALAVARRLSELPTTTYGLVKRQLRGDAIERIERILADESDPLLDAWLGEETATAASSLLRESGGD